MLAAYLPGPGPEGWGVSLQSLCDLHTDNVSYSVIFISPDSENQSHLDWHVLHPTFKYMIQLYLPAGFCDRLKSPDCRLEDRATCSISFGPAAGVSDLTHGHMEIPAHRTFVFPDPCGPGRKCPRRSRGCALVSFSLPLASLHLPWP